MKKIIIVLVIAIIAAILSGCIDNAVSTQQQKEIKKSTITVIKSESIFGVKYDNYKVIHDNELNQTCTIYLYSSGAGISCTPDSQLYESGHYGR